MTEQASPTKPPIASPRVSVVIPAYNTQRYLAESLESILNQSFEDFECIVVDDGSVDRTPQIIDDFATRDPRVKRLTIPHGGIVKGLNAGLEAACGQYIARTDADDICLPQRFERQVRYLDEHPECVIAGSKVTLVDPYNSPLWDVEVKADHEDIVVELLRGNGWAIIHPSAMLRRETMLAVGGYRAEYEWVEDLDLFLRMGQLGRLTNLQEPLLRYRQHFASVNRTRLQLQIERTQRAVLEGYQRRGQSPPADLQVKVGTSMTRPEQIRSWLHQSRHIKNWNVARRHGWGLLREEPWKMDSWKLMMRTLLKR